MKYLKVFICLLLFQLLLAISPVTLMAEEAASNKTEKENQEKESKNDLAEKWNRKGDAYYEKKEYTAAIECYQKALELNPGKIEYVYKLSNTYKSLNKFSEGESVLKRALIKFKEKSDVKEIKKKLSDIYTYWAKYLYNRNKYLKAIEYYEKTLVIKKELNDRFSVGRTLNYLGFAYYGLNQHNRAIECFKRALALYRGLKDRYWEGGTLNDIGFMYLELNQPDLAVEYFGQALPIHREVKNRAWEGNTLNNLGEAYEALNQYEKAIKYYDKALIIRREIKDRLGEGETLNKIGFSYKALNQYDRAVEYFEKALTIRRELKDLSGEGRILNNIGLAYKALNQCEKAIKYYNKALIIRRQIKDRSGEGGTLHNLGSLYHSLGQYNRAIEYYEQALSIHREVKNRSWEGNTLNGLGIVYNSLNQYEKAIKYYHKALIIRRQIKDRSGEGGTLYNLGSVFHSLRQYDRTIEYFEQALSIHREVKNRSWEGIMLHNLGTVYDGLGQYDSAIEYYEQALSIHKELKNRSWEGITLNSLGIVYDDLGQYEKAIKYFNKALTIRREINDRSGEGGTLHSLGLEYYTLRQYDRAIEYYEQALAIHREVRNRSWEEITLHNLGLVYFHLNKYDQAIEYMEKALAIDKELKHRYNVGGTLSDLGLIYKALCQYDRAVEYCEKALAIHREVKNNSWNGNTLSLLMDVWKIRNRYPLAVFYGKQSVNVVQESRKNIKKLSKVLQRSYLERYKHRYRNLVNLLITEGRLSEAQQVLDMLKEQEYFNFIRKDRSAAASLSTQVDFTEFEKQWLEKYNAVIKKLGKVSSEHHALKFKKNRSEVEEKKFKELESRVKGERRVYEDFMAQMKEAFDSHEKEIQEGRIPPDMMAKEASALQETLKYLDEKEGGRDVALHYLVYKGKISVILTTPASQVVKQCEISEKEFNRKVMAYRNFMMKAGRGVHKLKKPQDNEENLYKKIKICEKCIYDFIFRMVDEELKKYGATNLVVSLDGVLRYLPLGALWDGENYLLQRYRIAIVTPSSLKNIKEEPVKEKRILGLGASRGSRELPPLPNVPAEIRFIVKDEANGYYGLIRGKAFIDDDFTKDKMVQQLRDVGYPLVHIASHFKFSPGDETKNHLLLGDGTTMKLSEIRRMGKLFNNVKLLVLSACQTGVGGNGEEIDGFGELAQQSGAKSVVASLWPVADESTKDLMLTFYGKLKEGKVTGKIEALRQAQLELAGLEDLLAKDKNRIHQSNRQKTEYSHPYYWGSFIMMGNWR